MASTARLPTSPMRSSHRGAVEGTRNASMVPTRPPGAPLWSWITASYCESYRIPAVEPPAPGAQRDGDGGQSSARTRRWDGRTDTRSTAARVSAKNKVRAPEASGARTCLRHLQKVVHWMGPSPFGGGSGIRTHGALRHNGFRDRPIRPLSHPSGRELYSDRRGIDEGHSRWCGVASRPPGAARSTRTSRFHRATVLPPGVAAVPPVVVVTASGGVSGCGAPRRTPRGAELPRRPGSRR